jgi:hypothetical protein
LVRMLVKVPNPVEVMLPIEAIAVAKRFVVDAVEAKRFVDVALVVVAWRPVKFCRVDEAVERKPTKVGKVPKTSDPVPVESVRMALSSADVSISVVKSPLPPLVVVRHVPLMEKQPPEISTPLDAVVVPPVKDNGPAMLTLEEKMPVDTVKLFVTLVTLLVTALATF